MNILSTNIYLDYAAAAPLRKGIASKMARVARRYFANPSSIHRQGKEAHDFLESLRSKTAKLFGVRQSEIIWTASGTESIAMALHGVSGHIITTSIEHAAILKSCKGRDVTILPVRADGRLDPLVLEQALRPDTTLVSIGYVNSEIGVVQDIRHIAKTIKSFNDRTGTTVLLHLDACQAPQYFDLTPSRLGVDLMTLNSAKIGGPKGVGLLYKRQGVKLEPLVRGGGQEFGLRSGTENIAGVYGFVIALEEILRDRKKETLRVEALQQYFFTALEKQFPFVRINGSRKYRTPSNVHFSVPGVLSEVLVLAFDKSGIAVSAGSACGSADDEPSHVLSALYGKEPNWGSVRVTMGSSTTKKDIDRFLRVFKHIARVYQLR